MLLVILFTVAFAALPFVCQKYTNLSIPPLIPTTIVSTMFGVVFGFIVATIIGSSLPTVHVESNEVEIVSLGVSTGGSNTLFLGIGNLETEEYITYYRKKGDGFRKDRAPMSESIIIEDSPTGATVTIYDTEFRSSWMYFIGIARHTEKRYEFHVESGSVPRTIELH